MLNGVIHVDCFMTAGESVLNKGKQDTISFIGTVEKRTDTPCLAELGAGEGGGCRGRLDGLFLLYGSHLREDTTPCDERLLYFGVARRWMPAPA